MNKKMLSLVNQIKDMCEYGGELSGRFTCLNRDKGKPIVIKGEEKCKKFHYLIEQIWKCDNEIYQTIWQGCIEIKISEIIVNFFRKNASIENELESLINELLSIEKEKWIFFMDVYGVVMETEKPMDFGQFTIYNWEKHRYIIEDKFKNAQPDPHAIHKWARGDEKYLISVAVVARDLSRAKSLADEKFRQAENIFAYLGEDINTHSNIGILHYNKNLGNRAIAVSSNNRTGLSEDKLGNLFDVYIDRNVRISNNENGNYKIWEIASKSNKSEIEKRILIAVEWIGKGVNDLDDAKAFVQFIFAIEGLLKQNEQGIINSSISSQISETAAFLIGDTLEERVKIEKLCKNLYAKRSAIAHGGSQSISKEDLDNALYLSKKLVIKILTSTELNNINSINEIQEWVKKKKYS